MIDQFFAITTIYYYVYAIILGLQEEVPDRWNIFDENKAFLRKMFYAKIIGFKKIYLLILSVWPWVAPKNYVVAYYK